MPGYCIRRVFRDGFYTKNVTIGLFIPFPTGRLRLKWSRLCAEPVYIGIAGSREVFVASHMSLSAAGVPKLCDNDRLLAGSSLIGLPGTAINAVQYISADISFAPPCLAA